MPRFPKAFGRRRSTTNALEEFQNAPVAEPSFRVFERPNGSGKSFDGGVKLAQSVARPTTSPRQKEDNMFEGLKVNRSGSGASNSNTASTTDNSSRLSAASTAPSSTDLAAQDKSLSLDRQYGSIPLPPVPKMSSGFSLKAAGRTFSFGRAKPATPSPKAADDSPTPPPKDSPQQEDYSRPRAVTTSSYASTATPPKIEDRELSLSLGGDFADMFTGFGNRKSVIIDGESNRAMTQTPDNFRRGPAVPARTYAGGRQDQPSPLSFDNAREVEASPYSWSSQNSQDRLISNSSPVIGPPVPRHGSPLAVDMTPSGGSTVRQQRVGTSTESGLKRNSGPSARRHPPQEYVDAEDEDTRLLKESLNAARRLTEGPVNSRVRDSWMVPLNKVHSMEEPLGSSWGANSIETTPRAHTIDTSSRENSMFAASASLAQRYSQKSDSPSPPPQAPRNKVMTPAQFEKYRRESETLNGLGNLSRDEDIEDEDEAYDDDEDEAEKQRQVAKQRRKQEAHMSIYRQQMMKVTGEAPPPAAVNRPSLPQSQNTYLQSHGSVPTEDGDEGDEEIPLAILAAHGFPNKNRPPTRLSIMNSNPNIRASSQIGTYPPPPQSVTGEPAGGSRLPVFARNLPPDPYLGAGLVNPTNRESLAFGGGTGSIYGGSQRGAPPGGLVGVIATEERLRAMRRGSPNAAGDFGPPANGFNGMGAPQVPQMPLGVMMGNMNGMGPVGPVGPMGPMGPMPMLTPGDHAQLEMAHQMQQFMQMQMQFMQMMASNQGRPQSQNGQALSPQAPQTADAIRPLSAHQRTMSMLNQNPTPWQQQNPLNNPMVLSTTYGGGYTPSIAPSERSNIGLPGRYRPVSQLPVVDKPRPATMSGALQDWSSTKRASVAIKGVNKVGNTEDDDDDEGWEAMKQKREKKKLTWKSKKADSDKKEMLEFIA